MTNVNDLFSQLPLKSFQLTKFENHWCKQIAGLPVLLLSLIMLISAPALLALVENPANSNLWLSDPDTSGVIRLVIKSHHEERFNKQCDADIL